jgi:hypothetical protein
MNNDNSNERLNTSTKNNISEILDKFLVDSLDETSPNFGTRRKKSMTFDIKENRKSWN